MNFVRAFCVVLVSAIFLFLSLSLYYLLSYNENLFIYGLPFGVIVVNLIHIFLTIKLVKKYQMGKWIFILYIPFINILAFFVFVPPLISILKIPMFQDSEDCGLGLLLMFYLPLHWFIFILGVLIGHFKKRKINNKV